MKVSVLGCGRWGTFLAYYVSKKHDCTLWGRPSSRHIKQLMESRKNEYLTLPESTCLTTDLGEALKSDVIIISILAQEFKSLLQEVTKFDLTGKKFVLCMKGIEAETGKRLTEIAIDYGIDKNALAVWVGPGHVQNYLQGTPNCMLIDAYDVELAKKLVDEFSSELIRFYIGTDIIGAEIGAAAKNVLGIAAGMLDGLDMSCLKGALMARGTREVSRLVKALGGNSITPYGLSHLGDFEATLFSPFSHNRKFGEVFIKGEKYEKSAEGVGNIKGFMTLCKKYNVEMPITEVLYNIIYENKDANEQMKAIFARSLKYEFEGI
ncbi:MAG: NAD(P)H-dependent glycerol-3-phosphate dehydrogenase [Clostridia bacterium]|nr:NAD(P)H-dependent glycerol-3-phosphate dehydrogenase [Clostridia bacterium]